MSDLFYHIYVGDCLKRMDEMADNSIDLIFADPPFNMGKKYGNDYDDKKEFSLYLDWSEKWIKKCFDKLKASGSIFIMQYPDNVGYYQVIMDKYGTFQNLIIWNASLPACSKNRFLPHHQDILFYTKTGDYKFIFDAQLIKTDKDWKHKEKFRNPLGDRISDVWDDINRIVAGCLASKEAVLVKEKGNLKKAHPCQMPLKLIERIIKFTTKEGDLILDPFIGSGTTMKSSFNLGRNCIGIELNPEYLKLIKERCEWGKQKLNQKVEWKVFK